jgi:nucleotide-binding universal stress UspA family protein
MEMKKVHYKKIAYCTDFSDHANEAFDTARDLAERYGATLHIVHVLGTFSVPLDGSFIPMEPDVTFFEKASQAAQASVEDHYVSKLDSGVAHFVHLLSGYPATEIVELAKKEKIDLIVMGSHGLTGVAHVFFGSTADRVVRRAPCSVMTVRPKGKA